MGIIIIKELI